MNQYVSQRLTSNTVSLQHHHAPLLADLDLPYLDFLLINTRMDGWKDGWMDGWMDG